jgi:hypothetical protein
MRRGQMQGWIIGLILLGIMVLIVALIVSGQAQKMFAWVDVLNKPRP